MPAKLHVPVSFRGLAYLGGFRVQGLGFGVGLRV